MTIGRWTFGLWPGFGFEWNGRHEYWYRYAVGPFYVLKARQATPEENLRREWPAIMREDGRRMEIICPHGVGHPVQSMSIRWESSWMGVHGCDGCCSKALFSLAELAHLAERRDKP